MTAVYLFDWGDTLMVDLPDAEGKMCHWPQVFAIEGAQQTLKALSANAQVYIATGAADSAAADILQALARVGLDQYIRGVFCQANLGVGKESQDFFPRILQQLNQPSAAVTMVGDSLYRDVMPALLAGINAIWFNPDNQPVPEHIMAIDHLQELLACAE